MTYVIVVLSIFLVSALFAEQLPNYDHIADPCKARNVLSGRLFVDPVSGHECAALVDMNEMSGAELIIIDLATGEGVSHKCPAGHGGWAILEVPGERVVVGTFFDGQFMVFDLKEKKFIKHVGLEGEEYIWEFAIGSDGRLYGGTYPGGKLVSLDLTDYTVQDCGAPAPPNMYLRNVSTLPDGRIFCNFGMDTMTQMIFDPASGEFSPVPEQLKGISKGVSWNGYFLVAEKAFAGKELSKQEQLPIPQLAENVSYWVDSAASTPETLVLCRGDEVYTLGKEDKAPVLVNKENLKGGRMLDARGNKVLGIRGQDYFVLEKDQQTTFKRIPEEAGPREVLFLRADNRGNLWGGPTFGQTLFKLDPTTKEYTNTATVCDSAGEVYDLCFDGENLYAASYSGGNVICYNPQKPWNQFGNENPKTLTSLIGKGYIRPVGGISVAPDGKIYSGWMASYGVYGGAVAVTDPASRETELIENPLGELAVYGTAVDSDNIYIGTSLSANGLQNKPDAVVGFGVMDISDRNILFKKDFPGAVGVHIDGIDRELGRVVLSVDGKLMLFDTKKKDFVEKLPDDLLNVTSFCSVIVAGVFWYTSGNQIIQLDIASLQWSKIAELTFTPRNIALAFGKIYVSSGKGVFEISKANK